MDVVYALKRNGRVLYGYGAWFWLTEFYKYNKYWLQILNKILKYISFN